MKVDSVERVAPSSNGAGAAMSDTRDGLARMPESGHARPHANGFVIRALPRYRGLVRRFFVVHRHLAGLLAGGLVAYAHGTSPVRRRGLRSVGVRLAALLVRPFLSRELAKLPFPQQLRRRLELLGPTYVKLGQIMAIREDLLPATVCAELQTLFDRVPPVPFTAVRGLIESGLGEPIDLLFQAIDPEPLGSASIAQAHAGTTLDGERVVIKVMKPGMREIIEVDLRLLRMLGVLLQKLIPRYQPRRVIGEFCAYTRREVDFTFEADNAEMFAANFRDMDEVEFPRIHRELSSSTVLTMSFVDDYKPGSVETLALTSEDRERLIDLGACAIIRMLYQDGFFHADLHPANLLVLRTDEPRIGFIDLGMVGRFEERTKRRMLYYFHALVTHDSDGAAKFLAEMATVGAKGDPEAFRRAVADLSRRFVTRAGTGSFSLAQLILESVGLGARYGVFFPVEMTLMVKALVTFEGVGRMLDPKLDIVAISRKHVSRVFQRHLSPHTLGRELLRETPELLEVAVQLPQLIVSGVHYLEDAMSRKPPQNPLAGVRSSILAGACIVGAVISVTAGASMPLGIALFAIAALFVLWGK